MSTLDPNKSGIGESSPVLINTKNSILSKEGTSRNVSYDNYETFNIVNKTSRSKKKSPKETTNMIFKTDPNDLYKGDLDTFLVNLSAMPLVNQNRILKESLSDAHEKLSSLQHAAREFTRVKKSMRKFFEWMQGSLVESNSHLRDDLKAQLCKGMNDISDEMKEVDRTIRHCFKDKKIVQTGQSVNHKIMGLINEANYQNQQRLIHAEQLQKLRKKNKTLESRIGLLLQKQLRQSMDQADSFKYLNTFSNKSLKFADKSEDDGNLSFRNQMIADQS